MTAGFMGAQIAWGMQAGIATPTFRELGLSQSSAALIWLAGPVSGCVAQPLVGSWSDRCTARLGRRRPFILAAAAAVMAMMLLFGSAKRIGQLLGDGHGVGEPKPLAICVGVLAFWGLDLAINALQGPVRALASDVFNAEQQVAASGVFALHTGLGNCMSFGLGSLDLVALSGGFFMSQVQALFTIACAAIAILSGCTLVLAKERRHSFTSHEEEASYVCQYFGRLKDTLSNFPFLLKVVFAVQFFTSMGKNGSFMFVTDWFGEDVYHGNPRAPEGSEALLAFAKGVRMGSLAMLCCGIVSGLFGLLLPYLLRLAPLRLLWAAALGFGALVMCLMALCSSSLPLAFALTVALGVALGARESIPWAVVTAASKGSDSAGANTAVFNLSQAVPSLMSALVGSAVLRMASVSAIFAFCALPMAAAVAVVLLRLPPRLDVVEAAEVGGCEPPGFVQSEAVQPIGRMLDSAPGGPDCHG